LRVDGVALEIVPGSGIRLAHHVEMALQYHAGRGLAARAGRFPQDQVACAIDDGSDVARLRPFDEMLAQRRFMQRGTRDRAQRGEVRPDSARLQVFQIAGRCHRSCPKKIAPHGRSMNC
jgi:hypothetical protein